MFVLAGTLNATVHSLAGEDRVSARSRRRQMVILGDRQLAHAYGTSPAYQTVDPSDIDVQAALGEQLEWISVRTGKTLFQHETSMAHARTLSWLQELVDLKRTLSLQEDDQSRDIAAGLIRSIIRPLCESLGKYVAADPRNSRFYLDSVASILATSDRPSEGWKAQLRQLAASLEVAMPVGVPELREAVAGLHRLCALTLSDDRKPAGSSTLTGATPVLTLSTNGPYLLDGVADIVNYLGVPLPINGPVALCRCGQSALKPFCDGSHAVSGFSDDKDVHRIADLRRQYNGQQATIFDNRGLCAHSGFCTDRLNTVFHLGAEPFVTPSGGRLDDIMRAVRRCPSGALSFGTDGKEKRDYVDQTRPPSIEVSKDGPYRITGAIPLADEVGAPVPRNKGASGEHYSLCRCGSSLNKPFCSGMHWSVNFADPQPPADWEPTLFEWAGGYPALLDMTRIFYSRHVPSDPLVGPLFARMEVDHPERVAAWLSEVFGGPSFYSERYGGYTRMISQHLDKHLTQEQRSHWAMLMAQSADEAGLPNDPEFRSAFMAYIEWGSRIAVENSTGGAKPPANMPVPRWWWVCNATPNARVSALAHHVEEPAPLEPPSLSPEERPGFAEHIKPLFRPMDRNSMKFVFDLWSCEDVRKHADAILSRVRAGTMPCDKAWAPEKVELFRRWVEGGMDA